MFFKMTAPQTKPFLVNIDIIIVSFNIKVLH